jgi:hypothetical protein
MSLFDAVILIGDPFGLRAGGGTSRRVICSYSDN